MGDEAGALASWTLVSKFSYRVRFQEVPFQQSGTQPFATSDDSLRR